MSKLQVNDIVNKDDDGSVGFSRGAVVTGVTTTTTLAVTGVATATTLKVGSAITAFGGIVTATTFSGDVTGDVTGNADTATTATNAQGLTGTPNITVGSVVGSALTITGITSIASVGIGTTNPATGLHLYGKALRIDDANITMQATAPMIILNEYGSTYGDQNWAIVRDADSFSIRWKNTSPYPLRSTIDSNGDLDKVFLRQSKVEVNDKGAKIAGVTTCNPGSSVGETNIGLSVTGDSASLDLVNHSAGDYAINNPELDHRIVFYNGTSGLELRYENDANKMVEVDNGGVKSPYITNTTATSGGSALRIESNVIKPQSSTRRLKNNIRNYVGAGLSRIEQMVPRTWEDFSSGDTYSGFVAEELHDIGFESAIVYREYQGGSEIGIGDTYGSMYGNGSTPVTKDGVELDDEVLVVDNFNDRAILAEVVIALKELKAENDSLKSRIAALESS